MRLQSPDRFNAAQVLEDLEGNCAPDMKDANLRAACEYILRLEMMVDDMSDTLENVA